MATDEPPAHAVDEPLGVATDEPPAHATDVPHATFTVLPEAVTTVPPSARSCNAFENGWTLVRKFRPLLVRTTLPGASPAASMGGRAPLTARRPSSEGELQLVGVSRREKQRRRRRA